MVRFDDRAAFDLAGFDDVRVNRALREKIDIADLGRLVRKHRDKLSADDLALFFRLAHARHPVEEALARVDRDQMHRKLSGKNFFNLLRLVLAHEAVIHVHAGQPLADRS